MAACQCRQGPSRRALCVSLPCNVWETAASLRNSDSVTMPGTLSNGAKVSIELTSEADDQLISLFISTDKDDPVLEENDERCYCVVSRSIKNESSQDFDQAQTSDCPKYSTLSSGVNNTSQNVDSMLTHSLQHPPTIESTSGLPKNSFTPDEKTLSEICENIDAVSMVKLETPLFESENTPDTDCTAGPSDESGNTPGPSVKSLFVVDKKTQNDTSPVKRSARIAAKDSGDSIHKYSIMLGKRRRKELIQSPKTNKRFSTVSTVRNIKEEFVSPASNQADLSKCNLGNQTDALKSKMSNKTDSIESGISNQTNQFKSMISNEIDSLVAFADQDAQQLLIVEYQNVIGQSEDIELSDYIKNEEMDQSEDIELTEYIQDQKECDSLDKDTILKSQKKSKSSVQNIDREKSNFFCCICDNFYHSLYALMLHLRTIHGQDDRLDKVCADIEVTHLCFITRCPLCNLPFHDKTICKHLPKDHGDHPDVKVLLETCTREIKAKLSEKKEAKIVKQVCTGCGQTLSCKSASVAHWRFFCKQNPERCKVYHCTICGIKFTDESAMLKHKKMNHDDNINFMCHICSTPYKNRNCLYMHNRRKHPDLLKNPQVKNFDCDICHKVYFTKKNMERHRTSHFDARKCQCEICGKAFKHDEQVVRHQKTQHYGHYPYHCDKCGHGVEQRKYLETHNCERVRRRQQKNAEAKNVKEIKLETVHFDSIITHDIHIGVPQMDTDASLDSDAERLEPADTQNRLNMVTLKTT